MTESVLVSFYLDEGDRFLGSAPLSVVPEAGSYVILKRSTYKVQAVFHDVEANRIRVLVNTNAPPRYPGAAVATGD